MSAILEAFGSLVDAAAQAIRAEDGDYVVDGLLYCHKCHTPKQCRINVLGEVQTPMCLCKCAADQLEAEEQERKQREAFDRAQRMRQAGFPDAEMRQWTFDHDDHGNEKISTAAKRYAEQFREFKKRHKGLLFYGTVGTGKSFAAACIVNALIDRGIPCLMTNFARLINTLNGMREGRQEYIDGLSRFDLLVIDDFAAERDTEYMQEIVMNIIDARYRSGLPLIITTNLTAEELKHPADISKQRIYSRLFEMCVPIEVAGSDRRKDKLRDEYSEIGQMLGL